MSINASLFHLLKLARCDGAGPAMITPLIWASKFVPAGEREEMLTALFCASTRFLTTLFLKGATTGFSTFQAPMATQCALVLPHPIAFLASRSLAVQKPMVVSHLAYPTSRTSDKYSQTRCLARHHGTPVRQPACEPKAPPISSIVMVKAAGIGPTIKLTVFRAAVLWWTGPKSHRPKMLFLPIP